LAEAADGRRRDEAKLSELTEELGEHEERERRRKEEGADETLQETNRRLDKDVARLSAELEKKSQAVTWIEKEVASVRQLFRDREQRQSARHEAELAHVRRQNDAEREKAEKALQEAADRQRQLEVALKELAGARQEVARLTAQVAQCEDEMRALLREMDRRKQAALQLAKALG
jgi:hypothetical protein